MKAPLDLFSLTPPWQLPEDQYAAWYREWLRRQGALPQFLVEPTEDDYRWWREGSDDEYSEFTCDISDPPSKRGAQMSSGRGSGFATGMYAYQTNRDRLNGNKKRARVIQVRAAVNPLVVRSHPDQDSPDSDATINVNFQRNASMLLGRAEGMTPHEADRRWAKPHIYLPIAGKSYLDPWYEHDRNLVNYKPAGYDRDEALADIGMIIDLWRTWPCVHPWTLLLAHWGFDGIEWAGNAAIVGDSGDYGAVRFPPIDARGHAVGIYPISGRLMAQPTWADWQKHAAESGVFA